MIATFFASTALNPNRPTFAVRRSAEMTRDMGRRPFEIAGYLAGVVLVLFGIGAIAMALSGRGEVRDRLAEQRITATPDAAEITDGDLEPGQAIDTGSEAKSFAEIMEFHALEATGGERYAEMGRYLTEDGEDTNDEAAAAKDENGRPVENGARNLWVTETALATALNMSYMAEQLAIFGLVVGIALVLAGIGFVVLARIAVRPRPGAV
jgi:hypothetical protein